MPSHAAKLVTFTDPVSRLSVRMTLDQYREWIDLRLTDHHAADRFLLERAGFTSGHSKDTK